LSDNLQPIADQKHFYKQSLRTSSAPKFEDQPFINLRFLSSGRFTKPWTLDHVFSKRHSSLFFVSLSSIYNTTQYLWIRPRGLPPHSNRLRFLLLHFFWWPTFDTHHDTPYLILSSLLSTTPSLWGTTNLERSYLEVLWQVKALVNAGWTRLFVLHSSFDECGNGSWTFYCILERVWGVRCRGAAVMQCEVAGSRTTLLEGCLVYVFWFLQLLFLTRAWDGKAHEGQATLHFLNI